MVGYKEIPTSDPEEQRLRDIWKASADRYGPAYWALHVYVWNRSQREVEEDRRRHPKAKRNLPVPDNHPSNRILP